MTASLVIGSSIVMTVAEGPTLFGVPLLTFFADIMALFGGGLMCAFVLDIAPDQYIDRLNAAIWLLTRTVLVAGWKAPPAGLI